jgi:hypothetical protein
MGIVINKGSRIIYSFLRGGGKYAVFYIPVSQFPFEQFNSVCYLQKDYIIQIFLSQTAATR